MAMINTTFSFRDEASSKIAKVAEYFAKLTSQAKLAKRSNDSLSAGMKDLSSNANRVKKSLDPARRSMGDLALHCRVMSNALNPPTKAVQRFSASFVNLKYDINNANNEISNFATKAGNSVGKFFDSFDKKKQSSAIATVIGVNSALELVGKTVNALRTVGDVFGSFVKDASNYQSMLTNLNVAFGDVEQAGDMFKQLQQFAAETPFTLENAVKSATMLRSAGVETEKLIPTMALLGDLAKGNSEAFRRMAINYTQILSRGFATQQDLNEFATWGVSVKRVLGDMGIDKKAPAQAVTNAMIELTSEGQAFHNSMVSNARTFAGYMEQAKDSYQRLSAEIGSQLLPPLQRLIHVFDEFFNRVRTNEKMVDVFFKPLNHAVESLVNNFDSLASTLVFVGGVIITLVALFAVLKIAMDIASLNPFTIAIVAAAILTWNIYELNKQYNELHMISEGTLGSMQNSLVGVAYMVGVVWEVIRSLGTILYDAFGAVFNIIYDVFLVLGDVIGLVTGIFTGSIFKNPLQWLKNLLIDLGLLVLGVLEPLSAVSDLIYKVTMGMFGVKVNRGAMDDIQDWRRQLQLAKIKNGGGIAAQVDSKQILRTDHAEKMINLASTVGKDFDLSFNLKDKMFKNYNTLEKLPFDLNVDPEGNLKVREAKPVKTVKLDLEEDFRDLLIQNARQRFQTYFNTVVPHVTIGDLIFEEDIDYTAFIDTLQKKIQEVSTAELVTNY